MPAKKCIKPAIARKAKTTHLIIRHDEISPAISLAKRELARHLLSSVIPAASPNGCTPDEISKWIKEAATKLSASAFAACADALEAALANHPNASIALPQFNAIRKMAEKARRFVSEFEEALEALAVLNLRNSPGLYDEVGIPSYLVNPLRKTPAGASWYPPEAYITGRSRSGLPWALPVADRIAPAMMIR
jgi:hypothetical protein